MLRWVGAALLLLASSAIIAGCGTSKTPNMLDPRGPIAASEAGLFWLILGISTVVFVLVTGALLYSIIKFRARPDSPAPRQLAGNTKLEIAWTIVPSVVLFIVLVATITTMLGLAQPANTKLTVNAIGHQWWWEFQIPQQDGVSKTITMADELHIPAGQPVQINLISDNVIHSFWVPQLGGKTDVIPGHNNTMWLQGDKPGGPFRGMCAEFCGTQHAHMDFYVMVDSPDDFQAWLQNEQSGPVQPNGGQIAQGQQVFLHNACIGCHQIDGVHNLPNAIGPNLTHFGSRLIIGGGVLENNPQNLKQWILHTQEVKDGSDMPSFAGQISDSDVDALVAYLESLK
ncbi:MAG TPA: cytochrome c oxidase subunit II [Ktedonobacterales bacterium]